MRQRLTRAERNALCAEVGRRVRRARRRQGLTREVLALLAGLRPRYVTFLERGTPGYYDDRVLAALAPALEVPAADLAPAVSPRRS